MPLNGSKIETDNPFQIKFKEEIKLIHKKLCGLNPELFESFKLRKEYDAEGRIMNVILCKIENELLLTAVQHLKSLGFNIDVLVFDGLMVPKEEGKEIDDNLLSSLSQHVKDKSGYEKKFLAKNYGTIN